MRGFRSESAGAKSVVIRCVFEPESIREFRIQSASSNKCSFPKCFSAFFARGNHESVCELAQRRPRCPNHWRIQIRAGGFGSGPADSDAGRRIQIRAGGFRFGPADSDSGGGFRSGPADSVPGRRIQILAGGFGFGLADWDPRILI